MAQIFISYTRDDAAIAQRAARALVHEGYSVFYDANLAPGDSWDARIESELEAAKAVLVLWTPSSRDRQWVRNEARNGLKRGILCPAMAKKCEIPVEFDHVQTADLTAWRGDTEHIGWRQLEAALQAKCGAPSATAAPSPPRPTPPRPSARRPPYASFQPGAAAPQATAPQAPPRVLTPVEPPPTPRRSTSIWISTTALAIGGLVVIGGGYTVWNSMQSRARVERTAWDTVDRNDAGALRAFVSGEPGPFREEAEQALSALEERSFEAAQNADAIEAFETFLRDFPQSDHALAARGRIAELQSMPNDPPADPDLLPPGTTK